jgi:hypothetical protein
MTIEYIGDGNSDGTSLGQSGEKISFFGTTPKAVATITTIATAATLGTAVASIRALEAELRLLGLIA